MASRPRATPLVGGLFLALLGLMLVLQASGIWNIVRPDTASETLLLFGISTLTFVAFIIFAFIFLRSLVRLRRERQAQELGSKLKTRLVWHFIAVSLLPITAMAVFSYLFFNRSLEKWFSAIPEEAIKNARLVQLNARQEQFQGLQEKARLLAAWYGGQPSALNAATLERLRREGGLTALALLDASGATLNLQKAAELDEATGNDLQQTLDAARRTQGQDWRLTDGKGFDAVVVPLNTAHSLLAVSSLRTENPSVATIESSALKLDQLKMEQRKVRRLGLLALALLTLLLLFASSWVALYLGRNIATPVMDLVKAAGEVGQGNLSYRVTARAEDEVALLAQSFNQMTAQLGENRSALEANAAELRDKNLALEERRVYIETVLESSSAGVVSFDEENRVTTINAAAQTMLRAPAKASALKDLLTGEDLATLERLLARARRMGRATEQTVLARGAAGETDTIPVAFAATALAAGDNGQKRGVVLVIEDLTDLLAAQRAAAWSEVARRLAHEIKNPLTPIQLSAERIAKNFKKMRNAERGTRNENADESPLPEKSSANSAAEIRNPQSATPNLEQIVDECTATITREVAGLKSMVDEFSRFARLPHAKLEPADLNEIVRQSVALYEDRLGDVKLDAQLAPSLPAVPLDAEQMRRAIVNLIENSLEAMADNFDAPRVTIATGHNTARGLLLLEVSDNGHGIAPAHLPRLFQPYFSTRGRGSGLGLAIVQRIITEHGGRIRAENNQTKGARFTIELPV
jgi:nitrogen fixation/metabolism regulation signal transduction histidine kinase